MDARPLDELADDLSALHVLHDHRSTRPDVHPIIQSRHPARAREGRKPTAREPAWRCGEDLPHQDVRALRAAPETTLPDELASTRARRGPRAQARNTSWSAADPRRSPHSGPRQITISEATFGHRRIDRDRVRRRCQSLAERVRISVARPGFVRGSAATWRSSSRSPGPPWSSSAITIAFCQAGSPPRSSSA